jgi:NAD(P)-dependent dehydrogenase (short-subunit alcohol dehydrogenase family)
MKEDTMTGKLDGKVAVISGGSAGIGLATAKRFVAEGAYVFITGRRQAELDAAVKEIGANVTGLQGDAAILSDLDSVYAAVKAEKGRIDILFANAGIYETGTLGEISESHFDKIFDVNVRGLLFTAEGTAADGRRRGHNPDRLHRRVKGIPIVLGLRCEQGRRPVVCTRLDCRSENPAHTGQRHQPGDDCHAWTRCPCG